MIPYLKRTNKIIQMYKFSQYPQIPSYENQNKKAYKAGIKYFLGAQGVQSQCVHARTHTHRQTDMLETGFIKICFKIHELDTGHKIRCTCKIQVNHEYFIDLLKLRLIRHSYLTADSKCSQWSTVDSSCSVEYLRHVVVVQDTLHVR